MRFALHAAQVAALSALLALVSLATLAQTPKPPGLFADSPETTSATHPREAIKGKSRAVKIDRKKLRKGSFFVSLPDGVSYEVVRSLRHERGTDRFAWVGHASDDPKSRAVFSVSGDSVAGTLSYDGKLFRLEPRADGSHILSEIRPTDPAPELDPITVADNELILADAGSHYATADDANGAVIDVLVAYTPAISALYGTAGAEALILQAVAEANQAYANSGMSTRLNLVHSVRTNYVESGNMAVDLERLRATSDGYMDELHSLRNTYGADLVSLLENEPQYCGIAYRMATLSPSFASNAFSVVHHSCATGYYSFAHEIGHNQGAHHDAGNASGAIFPYAYGYIDPNKSFRTIMSYNCPGGCIRISHFSNAEVSYNGKPTGYSGAAENADAIDNTAATVASFRQSAAPALPSAPSGLSAYGFSASEIDLTWKDNSGTELGFHIDRSADGVTFSQIASLPANATSYRDSSLTANTLYYYRSRAWNSDGNSSYTDIATASTHAFPLVMEQLVSVESGRAGVVTGIFQDTHMDDGKVQSIREVSSGGTKSLRYSFVEHYWAIKVTPGASITLHADASTNATDQKFTFAYSTTFGDLTNNKSAWIDMFKVSASTSGAKQFTLPPTPTGWIFVSVRDNKRTPGVKTRDSIQIDYLAVRTVSSAAASL
jgi:hypothetical protein